MKKLICLGIVILITSIATGSVAFSSTPIKHPRLMTIKIVNNPLLDNSKNLMKIYYKISRKVWVSAKITKNGKTVKILKKKSLKNRGRYYVIWKGRDRFGRKVIAGSYRLTISVKEPNKKKGVNYNKRVRVANNLLFSEYFDRPDKLIAKNSGTKDPLGKWDVTSQEFYSKNHHGYTNSPVFRVRTFKSDFKNYVLTAKVMKKSLGVDDWDGVNLFFSYKDPDNLYAAGLRNDNHVHIKKKIKGVYTTLAVAPYESNKINHWYNLKLSVSGNHIEFYVDGKRVLEADDSSILQGKVGLRTDNIKAYFDDFVVKKQ